jgi:hypothetical protein
MEAIGGGLTSRIIFVNEDKKNKLVIFPAATKAEIELQQMLIHDLEQITLMSGRYAWTEDALNFYADCCEIADKNPPFQDKKFDGYHGRRRNHLLSLSMVCAASHSSQMIIQRPDIERASSMLAEVEIKMGTIFRGIGKSDISSVMNDAILFFEQSLTPDVPLWSFLRRFEGDVDKLVLDRILNTLETAKYIAVIRRPGTDSVIHILPKQGKGIVEI